MKPSYPRRRLIRGLMRSIGRLGLPLLARSDIDGLEKFPKQGPLIVVGNHTGAMEVVLMTVYARRQVEYMGAVDIDNDSALMAFTRAYGLIPLQRGQTSRSSLETGLEVLRSGGVIGIFPEGGIWDASLRRAHTGVAWLSYHAQAPILPIGFSDTTGALGALIRLQRPRLTMRVGDLRSPVQISPGQPRKSQLQQAAQDVLAAIFALVPGEGQLIYDESFSLHLRLFNQGDEEIPLPVELQPVRGDVFSKVLHRATLISTLRDNLHLPVAVLHRLQRPQPAAEVAVATRAILDYIQNQNPYYFSYRYGIPEGAAMVAAITEMDQVARWAAERHLSLEAEAVRQFRSSPDGPLMIERDPVKVWKW